jgi:hypothetical protein
LTGRFAGLAGAVFFTGFLVAAGLARERVAAGFSTALLCGGAAGFAGTGTDSVLAGCAWTAKVAPCGSMSWVM